MSSEDDTATATAPRKTYFRRSNQPELAPDAAMRQGRVTKLALDAFGGKDAAIAYLNIDSASLGGRPLDIATASAEGLSRVERDLSAMR